MKVFLFGSMSLGVVPQVVERQLNDIIEQTNGDVEFIVGDAHGMDSAFHLVLSRIGARGKTKVYGVNTIRNNRFDLSTIVVDGGELAGREMYELRDKELVKECDFAICVWDGESRGTLSNINSLKARNKPVYVYRI